MKAKYLVLGLLFAGGLMAQATAPAKLTPSEIQSLRLQVKQRDAQIAQRDMNDATTRFQTALAALQEEGNKVKTENKWDADVVFNPNTLDFTKSAPASKPTEPAKK